MLFGLKNAGTTYQSLMNKIFAEHIETLMEVYIDDMLVKTKEEEELLPNLEIVFNCLQKHRMRLNPQKCASAVKARKILGFILTHWGIEVNPDKCQTTLDIKSLTSIKEVQWLTSVFHPKSAKH